MVSEFVINRNIRTIDNLRIGSGVWPAGIKVKISWFPDSKSSCVVILPDGQPICILKSWITKFKGK